LEPHREGGVLTLCGAAASTTLVKEQSMISRSPIIPRGLLAGAVALAAGISVSIAAAPALAQPYAPHEVSTGVGGVTVYAWPRYERQPTTGAWVEPDSVSLVVPLGDLDLSTGWGAHQAVLRIEAAARDACDAAETLYPKDVESEHGCYVPAVRRALAQAQAIAGYPILAWGYH
jgi:UrcA family protein